MTDPIVPDEPVADAAPAAQEAPAPADEPDLAALLAERTDDLQRLQAEYVNYKRRVDRDRDLARQRGIEAVLGDLLPVLDAISAARAHDQLDGGARMIADEIEKVTGSYGLTGHGAVGDKFDPKIHDALMHVDAGYRVHERVLRPARVAVTDPSEPAPSEPAEPVTETETVPQPDTES